MLGTVRRCQECGDVFTFSSASGLMMTFLGFWMFLSDFSRHVRAHRNLETGLNEAGLYYMGLSK